MMQTNVQYFKQLGEFSHLFGYMEMQEELSGKMTPEEFLRDKVCLDHVTFYYGEQSEKGSVLNHLSFTLSKGTWMGIEGATGAGKSTLLNLFLLLYTPIEGAVLLDGIDCTKISKKWYRSNISVVNQTPFLFAGTVRENMMLVNDKLTDDDIWNSLEEVMLKGLVRSSGKGLDMDIGEDGTLLSGGEKQRLAIAIAFAAKKPLLILDEATSNLDVDTERYIRGIIRTKVDMGLTVLSVSHRVSFHEKADKVFSFVQEM
jgi:ATP-binding cassette, subfamily B, bacterial